MLPVFLNVAPIFILIFLGWIIAKANVLQASAADVFGAFVFKFALPILVFRTLSTADFDDASPFALWSAYFLGVVFTWTVAHLIATRAFRLDIKMGVVSGLSASFANNVFIGIPLVNHIVGDEGLVAISILLAVHLPLMMLAGTVLMERAAAKADGVAMGGLGTIARQVVVNLARNPLVLGLVLGTFFSLLEWKLPPVIAPVTDQLAQAASPLALLSIGMTLSRYQIRGELGLTSTMAMLKLLLLPASILITSHWLNLSHDWIMALVLTSSVPTGVNAWLIAQHFNTGQRLTAAVIGMTTVLGVVSVSLWAWVLG